MSEKPERSLLDELEQQKNDQLDLLKDKRQRLKEFSLEVDSQTPDTRSRYRKRINEIETKEIPETKRKIEEIENEINERKERNRIVEKLTSSLNQQTSSEKADEAQLSNKNIEDRISGIFNPEIRNIERALRSNLSFWEEPSLHLPKVSDNYTISYLIHAWENLEHSKNRLSSAVSDLEELKSRLKPVYQQIEVLIKLIDSAVEDTSSSFLIDSIKSTLDSTKKNVNSARTTIQKTLVDESLGKRKNKFHRRQLSREIAELQISIEDIQQYL
ncbi:MAG: hypothetical protein AAFV85_15750, partial [Cyanobacteria bacterium J06634_6]